MNGSARNPRRRPAYPDAYVMASAGSCAVVRPSRGRGRLRLVGPIWSAGDHEEAPTSSISEVKWRLNARLPAAGPGAPPATDGPRRRRVRRCRPRSPRRPSSEAKHGGSRPCPSLQFIFRKAKAVLPPSASDTVSKDAWRARGQADGAARRRCASAHRNFPLHHASWTPLFPPGPAAGTGRNPIERHRSSFRHTVASCSALEKPGPRLAWRWNTVPKFLANNRRFPLRHPSTAGDVASVPARPGPALECFSFSHHPGTPAPQLPRSPVRRCRALLQPAPPRTLHPDRLGAEGAVESGTPWIARIPALLTAWSDCAAHHLRTKPHEQLRRP